MTNPTLALDFRFLVAVVQAAEWRWRVNGYTSCPSNSYSRVPEVWLEPMPGSLNGWPVDSSYRHEYRLSIPGYSEIVRHGSLVLRVEDLDPQAEKRAHRDPGERGC
jgi:hypothetical protein